MTRLSRRERLMRLATSLKLSFKPHISENELERLIDNAPATERQLLVLMDFMETTGRTLPRGLTYGRAKRALEAVMDTANERAIQTLRLTEGAVRIWKGEYFYVTRVYGANYHNLVSLRRVALSRPKGALKASLTPTSGKDIKVHPLNLLFVSMAVDLTTWQPTYQYAPKVDPDEPLF